MDVLDFSAMDPDIIAEYFRDASSMTSAAKEIVRRVREAIDEDTVQKLLLLLSTRCPSHPAITAKLAKALRQSMYPRVLIQYMAQLVGNTEAEVEAVFEAYRDVLSADTSLLVPALGSLADLQLTERMKRDLFALTREALRVVAEEEVPIVIRALFRTLSKDTVAEVLEALRTDCSDLPPTALHAALAVIRTALRLNSRSAKLVVRQLSREGGPSAPFDFHMLLMLAAQPSDHTAAVQCIAAAVDRGHGDVFRAVCTTEECHGVAVPVCLALLRTRSAVCVSVAYDVLRALLQDVEELRREIVASLVRGVLREDNSTQASRDRAYIMADALATLTQDHALLVAPHAHIVEESIHNAVDVTPGSLHRLCAALGSLCVVHEGLRDGLLIFMQKHLFGGSPSMQSLALTVAVHILSQQASSRLPAARSMEAVRTLVTFAVRALAKRPFGDTTSISLCDMLCCAAPMLSEDGVLQAHRDIIQPALDAFRVISSTARVAADSSEGRSVVFSHKASLASRTAPVLDVYASVNNKMGSPVAAAALVAATAVCNTALKSSDPTQIAATADGMLNAGYVIPQWMLLKSVAAQDSVEVEAAAQTLAVAAAVSTALVNVSLWQHSNAATATNEAVAAVSPAAVCDVPLDRVRVSLTLRALYRSVVALLSTQSKTSATLPALYPHPTLLSRFLLSSVAVDAAAGGKDSELIADNAATSHAAAVHEALRAVIDLITFTGGAQQASVLLFPPLAVPSTPACIQALIDSNGVSALLLLLENSTQQVKLLRAKLAKAEEDAVEQLQRQLSDTSLISILSARALEVVFAAAHTHGIRNETHRAAIVSLSPTQSGAERSDIRVAQETLFRRLCAVYTTVSDYFVACAVLSAMLALCDGTEKLHKCVGYVYATFRGPFPTANRSLLPVVLAATGGNSQKAIAVWLLRRLFETASRGQSCAALLALCSAAEMRCAVSPPSSLAAAASDAVPDRSGTPQRSSTRQQQQQQHQQQRPKAESPAKASPAKRVRVKQSEAEAPKVEEEFLALESLPAASVLRVLCSCALEFANQYTCPETPEAPFQSLCVSVHALTRLLRCLHVQADRDTKSASSVARYAVSIASATALLLSNRALPALQWRSSPAAADVPGATVTAASVLLNHAAAFCAQAERLAALCRERYRTVTPVCKLLPSLVFRLQRISAALIDCASQLNVDLDASLPRATESLPAVKLPSVKFSDDETTQHTEYAESVLALWTDTAAATHAHYRGADNDDENDHDGQPDEDVDQLSESEYFAAFAMGTAAARRQQTDKRHNAVLPPPPPPPPVRTLSVRQSLVRPSVQRGNDHDSEDDDGAGVGGGRSAGHIVAPAVAAAAVAAVAARADGTSLGGSAGDDGGNSDTDSQSDSSGGNDSVDSDNDAGSESADSDTSEDELLSAAAIGGGLGKRSR